ncbi:MAG: hypothetical protein Q7R81_06195 [Candidatus Peregrinibacteria bacterium]|nr:hypothetical protein [Candidatus Peregrinibacteria bacterium]
MRFLPIALVGLYIWVGFVPPPGVSKAAMASQIGNVFLEAANALDAELEQLHLSEVTGGEGSAKEVQELITRAIASGDARKCDFTDAQIGAGGTKGDWIAFCIARVTRSRERCAQIDATLGSALRKLCEEEVPESKVDQVFSLLWHTITN